MSDGRTPENDETLIALNDALEKLAQTDSRAARVVEMRYFTGLTHTKIAEILNVDRRTVDRDWKFAKTWLYTELSRGAKQ